MKFGEVAVGSTEWRLARMPRERVAITRQALELMQAELSTLRKVEQAARSVVTLFGEAPSFQRLRSALNEYEGWIENSELRDEIVDKLLSIAEELDHE